MKRISRAVRELEQIIESAACNELGLKHIPNYKNIAYDITRTIMQRIQDHNITVSHRPARPIDP